MIDERSSSIFEIAYCEYWAKLSIFEFDAASTINRLYLSIFVFSSFDTASTGVY